MSNVNSIRIGIALLSDLEEIAQYGRIDYECTYIDIVQLILNERNSLILLQNTVYDTNAYHRHIGVAIVLDVMYALIENIYIRPHTLGKV